MKTNWSYSNFSKNYESNSGILQLMNDLGKLNPNDYFMLGGGTPSHIENVSLYFNEILKKKINQGNYFNRYLFKYSSPQGEESFREILASYFTDFFKTKISKKNITLTNGSQNSFYALFNIFSGKFSEKLNGKFATQKKKILFPLVPEYIGYEDIFLESDCLVTYKAKIKPLDDLFFKYKIDFAKIKITKDIGAIAFSNPCNPSGNVLNDDEIKTLYRLAQQNNIPLIIDNAYGNPFPKVIYRENQPFWDENIIYTFSFSKIGLPGIRTGGVIAHEEVSKILSGYNAIANLSPSVMGLGVLEDSLANREIDALIKNEIVPFYKRKRDIALALFKKLRNDLPIYLHEVGGSFFLWVWVKGLKISTLELYEELKKEKVIIVPGEYFFYQFKDKWDHATQCFRLHYGVEEKTISAGLEIIFQKIKKMI